MWYLGKGEVPETSACALCVKKNVKIIKRKYIMTNIDTQETDYSVYAGITASQTGEVHASQDLMNV